MFGLRKTKNPYAQKALEVYADLLMRVRNPVFYTQFGVPDSFEGRFDLLLFHVFLVFDREKNPELAQAVFDAVFADMDQGLREAGIGDTGVPKRMRRMMKDFNGRMHAYDAALKVANDGALLEAVARNVYGDEAFPPEQVKEMIAYIRGSIDDI